MATRKGRTSAGRRFHHRGVRAEAYHVPVGEDSSGALVVRGMHDMVQLEAELHLSEVFGAEWHRASPADPEPYGTLLGEILRLHRASPTPDTEAAVGVVDRLLGPVLSPVWDFELAQAMAGQHCGPDWHPTSAWRLNVTDGSIGIVVTYDGPQPHEMFGCVTAGGSGIVSRAGILFTGTFSQPSAAQSQLTEIPVPEAMAILAEAMARTDDAPHRPLDPSYVDLRALLWSRVAGYLPWRRSAMTA